MHSIVGTFRMNPAQRGKLRKELDERIVPLVKHQPGFVSASWSYDTAESRSVAVVIFETERDARGMADFVKQHLAVSNDAGVELESLTVAIVEAVA